MFSIEWQENGSFAIKASNGRYVTARMNGSLYAVSDDVTEKERFLLTIVNRPRLVLKCDYGFVGFKATGNPKYECNKATYDPIGLEFDKEQTAVCYLKGMAFYHIPDFVHLLSE